MSRVRVSAFSLSLDGYGAGPDQDLEHPLGIGGEALHEWLYPTATFQQMTGNTGGTTGPDDELAAAANRNVGAWILGRNMFGPIRGEWPDEDWRGWWGEEPPYRTPVFVLTHYPRPSIEMKGGTTFHFVTDGIDGALERARAAAGERDVRIGGGVSIVRQYLLTGWVDELHLVISPVVLGSGEHLLEGIDLNRLGYTVTRHVSTERALHVFLERRE